LREAASLELDQGDYALKINGCFNLLSQLNKFYANANVEVKRRILYLNFPEKLIYENGKVQTPKMNEILALIMLKDSDLENKKRG
jgi:hypothetical protein